MHLFLPLALLLPAAVSLAAEKPNVIVILADDMGYGDPQCFNPQTKIATPDIRTAA